MSKHFDYKSHGPKDLQSIKEIIQALNKWHDIEKGYQAHVTIEKCKELIKEFYKPKPKRKYKKRKSAMNDISNDGTNTQMNDIDNQSNTQI